MEITYKTGKINTPPLHQHIHPTPSTNEPNHEQIHLNILLLRLIPFHSHAPAYPYPHTTLPRLAKDIRSTT